MHFFETYFFNSHLFSIQLLRTNLYVSFVSFTLSCFAFASQRYSWIIVVFCELFKWKCVSVHLPIANKYNYKIMFFLCIFSSFHIVSIFFVCSSWTVHVDVCYRGVSLNCLICLIVICLCARNQYLLFFKLRFLIQLQTLKSNIKN